MSEWTNFLKAHKGKGLTTKQIAALYRKRTTKGGHPMVIHGLGGNYMAKILPGMTWKGH
jgi:hypothetical protein